MYLLRSRPAVEIDNGDDRLVTRDEPGQNLSLLAPFEQA
jgi:hypothetical protein